jgi:hypothetical protein
MRTSHDIDCLFVAFQLVYLGGGLLTRGVRRAYVKLRRDDSNERVGQPHFCLLCLLRELTETRIEEEAHYRLNCEVCYNHSDQLIDCCVSI